jgi:hypothetical protein
MAETVAMSIDLTRLARLAQEATEGPWKKGSYSEDYYHEGWTVEGPSLCCIPTEADADFIAEARTALPALIEALREAVEIIREPTCLGCDGEGNRLDGSDCRFCARERAFVARVGGMT